MVAISFAYIIDPSIATNKTYLTVIIITVFWISTILNFFGMKISGWVSTVCALIGTIFPAIIIISLAAIWLFLGNPSQISFTFNNFVPKINSFSQFALLSSILMSLSGMEMSAVHANEVKNPTKNYPISIFISAIIIIGILSLGALAIAIVIPVGDIELPAGAIQAITKFLAAYHLPQLTPLVALFLTIGALGMVTTWTIGPVKGMYATAEHGELPIFLQKLNKHQVPINLLLVQAIIVTVFSFVFVLTPTVSTSYFVLINLSAHLYQAMYILMFISAIVLRYKKPDVERKYKIPFGNAGIWILGLVGIIGTAFSMIMGYFPPIQLQGFNIYFYETFSIGGTIIFCAIPFIIRHYRKPAWKLEHQKNIAKFESK
jgi:amino acid transporter